MIPWVSNIRCREQNTGVRCKYSKSRTQYFALLDTRTPKQVASVPPIFKPCGSLYECWIPMQWYCVKTCMRICHLLLADSLAHAHTSRKCSLEHKTIQHVEYLIRRRWQAWILVRLSTAKTANAERRLVVCRLSFVVAVPSAMFVCLSKCMANVLGRHSLRLGEMDTKKLCIFCLNLKLF